MGGRSHLNRSGSSNSSSDDLLELEPLLAEGIPTTSMLAVQKSMGPRSELLPAGAMLPWPMWSQNHEDQSIYVYHTRSEL